MSKQKVIAPFLKWVGGKRQIMSEIRRFVPKSYNCYYEPFIGGGAVLFELLPKKAIINDRNRDLMNTYLVIRDQVDELIADLKTHRNESDYFYQIRALDRSESYEQLSNIKKASRLIYLNKTCYNGLYRVNSSGEFNAPYGKYKNPNIINENTLRAVSNYLQKNDIKILHEDFKQVVMDAKAGDFVYFDPPYHPISKSSNFTGYVQGGFDQFDQRRLKECCDDLNARGVNFLLSNSSAAFITDLYSEYRIEHIKAIRAVNSNAKKRGEVDEVLIRNYEMS